MHGPTKDVGGDDGQEGGIVGSPTYAPPSLRRQERASRWVLLVVAVLMTLAITGIYGYTDARRAHDLAVRNTQVAASAQETNRLLQVKTKCLQGNLSTRGKIVDHTFSLYDHEFQVLGDTLAKLLNQRSTVACRTAAIAALKATLDSTLKQRATDDANKKAHPIARC